MTDVPHDPDAERALAGAAISSAWTGPVPDIDPYLIWTPRWRHIYRTGMEHRANGRPVTRTTFARAAIRQSADEAARSWVPPLDRYADRIRAAAADRQLIIDLIDTTRLARTDPDGARRKLAQLCPRHPET